MPNENPIKEGIIKAIEEALAHWIEKITGSSTEKVLEHIIVETAAAVIAAGLIAAIGFLISRSLWREVHRRWRSFTIRKASNTSFVIVRCLIKNDTKNTIGNEIDARLETAFGVFAGTDRLGCRPFKLVNFPLSLPVVRDVRDHDRAVQLAKRWLEKTGGHVLVWGSR